MKLLFLIKEGFAGLRRARLAAVITLVTITLALALIGLFALLVHNLASEFDRTYNQVTVEVFFDPSLPGERIQRLKQQLESIEGVASVYYVSPEEALADFQKSFGGDLLTALESNPLPPSFRVILRSGVSKIAAIDPIITRIKTMPPVDDVVFEANIIRLLNRYFNIALAIALVLGGTIFFISIILIYNTIRLTIHSRKTVVEIMQLVGATERFIKAPFIIEGILTGLFGSVLACGLLILFSNLVQSAFYASLSVPPLYFGLLVLTGVLVGWVGSYISVGKYLKF